MSYHQHQHLLDDHQDRLNNNEKMRRGTRFASDCGQPELLPGYSDCVVKLSTKAVSGLAAMARGVGGCTLEGGFTTGDPEDIGIQN